MEKNRTLFLKYSKTLEAELKARWLLTIGFLVILSVALIARLIFAGMAQHPGHGDHAFYYTVAENLADGKGLQIDYIWNYMNNPEAITHSSHGFWMPLTSIIISLFFFVFGKSLFVAILPSIIFGLALTVPAYFVGKIYSGSRLVAICSAGLVLFVPHLFTFSVLIDSAIYYALFVSFGLLFMIKGWTNPKFFLISAVCAGLAHLTRQDGVLLFITLTTVILFSSLRGKTKLVYVLLALGLYLLILLPLIIDFYKIFGSLFPPGPRKMMFLTHYEDHYSYSKELNLQTYFEWGTRNILRSKVGGMSANARVLHQRFMGSFLRVFVVIGILELIVSQDKRKKWRIYFPPLFFLAALFSFYAFIVPVGSGATGFTRSGMSIIPFLVVLTIDTINRNIRSRTVVILTILLISLSSFTQSIQFARTSIDENARLGEQLEALNDVLRNEVFEQDQDDIVIMTRNPWEVFHSTRYRAIQIPNENLDLIYAVAQKFHANYLLLPAPRKALEDIYLGEKTDDRFLYVAEVPDSDLMLFRIKLVDEGK